MDDGISEKNGVGFEDGLLDAIAVGGSDAGETFVPSSPSVGMGWRLAPEVGPEGINVEGRSMELRLVPCLDFPKLNWKAT